MKRSRESTNGEEAPRKHLKTDIRTSDSQLIAISCSGKSTDAHSPDNLAEQLKSKLTTKPLYLTQITVLSAHYDLYIDSKSLLFSSKIQAIDEGKKLFVEMIEDKFRDGVIAEETGVTDFGVATIENYGKKFYKQLYEACLPDRNPSQKPVVFEVFEWTPSSVQDGKYEQRLVYVLPNEEKATWKKGENDDEEEEEVEDDENDDE
jgi:hypothetical protein